MVKKITKSEIINIYKNNYDKKYYLRELASFLQKPHQTIKPYVESLVRENILIKDERKNITEYGLNFKDKKIYDYLTIAEKEILMQRLKKDVILRVLFEKLSKFFKKNTFIVLGSSVDKMSKESDIDLLVIGKGNISKEIKDFEDIYNKKVHKIQTNSIEKMTLTLIKEIYKKHIVFNNTESIIRFWGELYEENKLV